MQTPRRRPTPPVRPTSGFTLVELLIVILIIVILISILIPTVSKVRQATYKATTQNQLSQITGAIERYYADQHQYPGPLDDSYLQRTERQITGNQPLQYPLNDINGQPMPRANQVTQEENLVLGLFGGLKWTNTAGNIKLCYDPDMVGRGMIGMNPAVPKKFPAYIDDIKMLSPLQPFGDHYSDAAAPTDAAGNGGPADSRIPEILDKYPNSMPWLYLRAHPGKDGVIAKNDPDPPIGNVILRQYNLSDVYPYTRPDSAGKYIGEGKKISPSDYTPQYGTITFGNLPHGFQDATPPSGNARTIIKNDTSTPAKTYVYPYDAWPYFRDPGTPYIHTGTGNIADDAANTPRAKDRWILISAGPDRVYGTADDICSFGDVIPQ